MQHRYFAASNSAEGFKNYFSEIFSHSDRLYIIKGGPGTGKSSLMKRFAERALTCGYAMEYYYCSSDPDSLDGVLATRDGYSVGMIDGTPPHSCDPINPGAREEIVDLGRFWRSDLLKKQKNEIFSLSVKKNGAYKRAYSYLRSCGNLRAVTDSLLRKAIYSDKLVSVADKTAGAMQLKVGNAEATPAILSALGMTGSVRLSSFEDGVKTVYTVGDFYGVGNLFLNALRDRLMLTGSRLRLSYDPINPAHVDGIYIEDRDTAFVISDKCDAECDKSINPRRFVSKDCMREIRGELRYASRLYSDCYDGAAHALSEAKIYHFLLEDIYRQSMNFTSLGEYADELLDREFVKLKFFN